MMMYLVLCGLITKCTRSRDATHNGRTVGAAVHLFSYGQSLEPLPAMGRSVQKVHMQ